MKLHGGAIVDETALIKVLKEEAIYDNVVLTPHIGWPTDKGYEEFAENAVENILAYMEGKLTRALNPEAVQTRLKQPL